jgi:hypothetical protein
MTFAVLVIKNDQRRVVGTLWADDEAKARDLAPAICTCRADEQVSVCRTENREIPFRLNIPAPMQFC